jgi:hypothetical protein
MNNASGGQVLGDINLFGWFDALGEEQKELMIDYDEERNPTSPSANIVVGHLEQGAVHTLRVITGGIFRKKVGEGGAVGEAEGGGFVGGG